MDIQIIQDNKRWYTAMIKDLAITTQWDSRDELLFNIRESLACYYDAVSQKKQKNLMKKKDLRFYFDMKSIINATEI